MVKKRLVRAWSSCCVVWSALLACSSGPRDPTCPEGTIRSLEECRVVCQSEADCLSSERCDLETHVCQPNSDPTDATISDVHTFADAHGPDDRSSDVGPDSGVSCGNGVVDPEETCDIAIDVGEIGACPSAADCADVNTCTIDMIVDPGTCRAECSHDEMSTPVHGDGCCAAPNVPRSEDDDCAVLPDYASCREPSDCESGACLRIDALDDSICTRSCDHRRTALGGGCASDPERVARSPICLSRRVAAPIDNDPTCITWERLFPVGQPDTEQTALSVGVSPSGELSVGDVDVYFVFVGNRTTDIFFDVVPGVDLDVEVTVRDGAFRVLARCDSGGAGVAESCPGPPITQERMFAVVRSSTTTGGSSGEYTISVR